MEQLRQQQNMQAMMAQQQQRQGSTMSPGRKDAHKEELQHRINALKRQIEMLEREL